MKFGRMSKKQRDSLYAEVQRHQQLAREPEESGEDSAHSRSYGSTGSNTTLSDLDDITTLPDGLLFDLPLTPGEAAEYCALDLLEGGTSSGTGSAVSSSSSNQCSPEPSMLDMAEAGHLLPEPSLTHTLLGALSDNCSLLDIGKCLASTELVCRYITNKYYISGNQVPYFLKSFTLCV